MTFLNFYIVKQAPMNVHNTPHKRT